MLKSIFAEARKGNDRMAPDCPYRESEPKHGYAVHVGYTLPDGAGDLLRKPCGRPDLTKGHFVIQPA